MKQFVLLSVITYTVFVGSTRIQERLHDGNTQLTTRMFSEVVKKHPEKSVVLSAFSVITPLSLLALASEGASHDELLNAVGSPDDTATNAIFELIDEKFNSIKGIELKKASKLYIPLGYEVQDQFANISKYVFHSEIENINFGDNVKSAKQINTWVEDQTNQRIKDLIDPDLITPDTRGVLVNALYFKGSWKFPFTNDATTDQDFYVNKQKTLQIPTMHNTEEYRYKDSIKLKSKILELPYEGDQSSLLIVLPNDVDGIEQVMETLKVPRVLDDETNNLMYAEVTVSLPKFKIETTTNLKEVLIKMNVKRIFDERANLTKLLKTDENLYISDALQKAFIEINEEGAEAAAANAFILKSEIAIINSLTYEFIADHPFLFYLKVQDEILFNGVFYGS